MSTIKTNNISNVAGTASTDVLNVINGSAKAWVNFNGTGTVAIRQAYNVSSITDNGVGTYRINLTSALSDTNGSSISDGNNGSGGYNRAASAYIATTSAVDILSFDTGTNNLSDLSNINVSVFR